ncbi:hypothetical protein [uncultured Flavobacterium sp.]|uniref:hypothetical protein n=2 Tax=Flavobacterium TaxID=237 RepID=UPI002594C1DF|nr:hypothetical protein [uncultured Flavobacterium sp.]
MERKIKKQNLKMKIKYNFLMALMTSLFLSCKPSEKVISNISCSGTVTLQYDKIKRADRDKPLAEKNLDAFTVYFLNEYKDSIQAYVNNKLYYEKNLDGNFENLNENFGYNYSKDVNIPVLKIVSKTKNTCFDIGIDKNYKIIYVFLSDDGKWTVRFSNIFYLH